VTECQNNHEQEKKSILEEFKKTKNEVSWWFGVYYYPLFSIRN